MKLRTQHFQYQVLEHQGLSRRKLLKNMFPGGVPREKKKFKIRKISIQQY